MPDPRTAGAGPFNGVRYTSEPYDDAPNRLQQLVNGYIPDPESGSAFYTRPGIYTNGDVDGCAIIQGVHRHVGLDGVALGFVVADNTLYRWNGAGYDDVMPSNVTIAPGALAWVYMRSLGDVMVVTDGVNPPWLATDLTQTPVVGAYINFETPSVVLSIGSNDRRVANAAVTYVINGTEYTLAANPTGTALPAGTINALGPPFPDGYLWGVYRVSVTAGGTVTVAAGADNYTTGYTTEADAIAALPNVPTGEADLGYFTVRTALDTVWIAGTDALAGGSSGNPASETNYYGRLVSWSAYGPPVVYTGSMFFVLNAVGATGARTSIAWSEPNLPGEGYRQDDFDNVWELTQTGSDPIYALAATNDALYYSRAYSWGALSGAPNVNFQNTATHDVVSGNIGCLAPRTVQTFLNYVYFADALGRPYRFAVGGSPEPLWTQLRQWFDDNKAAYDASDVALFPWSVIEPNLNVWLLYPPLDESTNPTGRMFVFDANTGVYCGEWVVTAPTLGGFIYTAGTFPVSPGTSAPGTQVVFGQLPSGTIVSELASLAQREDDLWTDSGPTGGEIPMAVEARSGWIGFSLSENTQVTELRALAFGEAYSDSAGLVEGINLAIATTQTEDAATARPPQSTLVGVAKRYVCPTNHQQMGRGGRIVTTFYTSDGQVLFYRLEADAVLSKATIRDR